MLRYNHAIIERKWRNSWSDEQKSQGFQNIACVKLIPKENQHLNLENARLVVLTDFFAKSLWQENCQIFVTGGNPSLLMEMEHLGVFAKLPEQNNVHYDLIVLSRDFMDRSRSTKRKNELICGRLLKGADLADFLPDFGGDTLRIYFLFQGPPGRDYTFNWRGLVSAYRFVQHIWRLSQRCTEKRPDCSKKDDIRKLRSLVQDRVTQKKPHTALAAIMGYLNETNALTVAEVQMMAKLLGPFTPFLSAELTELVTTI